MIIYQVHLYYLIPSTIGERPIYEYNAHYSTQYGYDNNKKNKNKRIMRINFFKKIYVSTHKKHGDIECRVDAVAHVALHVCWLIRKYGLR